MKIKPGYYRYITIVYVIIEIMLYGSFLYIDLFKDTAYVLSAYFKFTGIILCFLYSIILSGFRQIKTDVRILSLALLFTLISDYFILMKDVYLPGMFSFSIVQTLYLIRLGIWISQGDSETLNRLIIKKFARNTLITFMVYFGLNLLCIEMDLLLAITCFYFVGILCNVKDSLVIAYKYRMRYQVRYAIGMVLFLLCDLNVGVFNLTGYITINESWFNGLLQFATIAMWLFYLPGQVLISLSGQTSNQ